MLFDDDEDRRRGASAMCPMPGRRAFRHRSDSAILLGAVEAMSGTPAAPIPSEPPTGKKQPPPHPATVASVLSIDPLSTGMQRWDGLAAAALLFTAFVTPYEVGLLSAEFHMNLLWVLNRAVDAVFVIDLFMQFLRAYDDPGTLMRVRNPRWTAVHYLRGWFAVDFVSCIPFGVIAQFAGGSSKLRIVRLVRLLRLLKLLRVMRGSRVLAGLEARTEASYRTIGLVSFLVLIIVVSHWVACLWALVGEIDSEHGWIAATRAAKPGSYEAPGQVYVAALHFAVMTLTTVGYGDIVPQTTPELVVGCVLMLGGGLLWAYIIGAMCSTLACTDPHGDTYKRVMDEVNYLARDHGMTDELRKRLRSYWIQSQALQRARSYKTILDRFTPGLRGEVVLAAHRGHVASVWYFRECGDRFVMDVGLLFEPSMFAPGEDVEAPGPPRFWAITNASVARRAGVDLGRGDCFGTDFLLQRDDLIDDVRCRAVTFVEVTSLTRTALDSVVAHPRYHAERRAVRRARLWITCRKAWEKEARKRRAAKRRAESGKPPPPVAAGMRRQAMPLTATATSPRRSGSAALGTAQEKASYPRAATRIEAAAISRRTGGAAAGRGGADEDLAASVDDLRSQVGELKTMLSQLLALAGPGVSSPSRSGTPLRPRVPPPSGGRAPPSEAERTTSGFSVSPRRSRSSSPNAAGVKSPRGSAYAAALSTATATAAAAKLRAAELADESATGGGGGTA